MLKLDAAFAELETLGYYAKQNWQCCNTCGWGAARSALKAEGVSDYDAWAHQKIVFYHEQDAARLKKTGFCLLAWEGDGDEIRRVMDKHGIFSCWDGSPHRRIDIFVGERE